MLPLLLPVFIVPAQFTGSWRRRCDERAVCYEASEAHECTQGRRMPVTTTIQTQLVKQTNSLLQSLLSKYIRTSAFCKNWEAWATTLTTKDVVYVSCVDLSEHTYWSEWITTLIQANILFWEGFIFVCKIDFKLSLPNNYSFWFVEMHTSPPLVTSRFDRGQTNLGWSDSH